MLAIIFAHLSRLIPRTGNEFRCTVGQVGGDDFADIAFLIVSIEFLQTIGEEAEGGADKDVVSAALFDLFCNVKHTLTGGDHIVDDNHILTFDISTEELMGNDRVASVNDGRVVAAFVEHTHVNTEVVCHVDSTAHTALIRADDHQMILVELHIRCIAQDVFDELVSRLDGFKSMQRNRVLDTRVVSVEGDDVFYAHSSQLLQTKCAVERLSSRSLVLAALIQEWHNDIDSAGFSTDGCDDTLQILEVVVRRHVVGVAAQRIGQAVVADIEQNVDIVTADRSLMIPFASPEPKRGT